MYRPTISRLWGEWSTSSICRFTPGQRASRTDWTGGWMGPGTGMDSKEKWTFFTIHGPKSDPSLVQSVASRYIDYAIVAKRQVFNETPVNPCLPTFLPNYIHFLAPFELPLLYLNILTCCGQNCFKETHGFYRESWIIATPELKRVSAHTHLHNIIVYRHAQHAYRHREHWITRTWISILKSSISCTTHDISFYGYFSSISFWQRLDTAITVKLAAFQSIIWRHFSR
jgi:hypothetical protein